MAKSLLFIPDISGFTHFVQTTEAEHSQHVISELLEVLISANTQELKLAEIEGDALFFYRENFVPSQEKLLAQIESMYTAFYSHLKLLEKHRICPCNACATAPQLQLKIVAHVGELQFLQVQNNRKPFGEAVIQAHRLLKNSVPTDNYALVSDELAQDMGMPIAYESKLFQFQTGRDTYDDKEISYCYAEIDPNQLKLRSFEDGAKVSFNCEPCLIIEKTFATDRHSLLELVTNYKYRHLWAVDAYKIEWNENEVTRLGTEHTCTIGSKQLNFTVVTKDTEPDELVYGELTTDPPPVDQLYQFFNFKSISENETQVRVELYWKARSPIKKLMMALFGKKAFRKGIEDAMERLEEVLPQVK
ncbi:DUF2652 domain-containing protein [Aureisphaera galaxeae]|uniref:DUF2652 domain-containing protein n=1 Tax=Aureisphaera galaxeae TaxID=1538023 RepID=UPI00235080ED|nr:DUF2652 domain-containing protein [Aureisphaera galaxeae]MDC8005249.1 DUF2652 domain-containing protein [Aureisphaera galaxeae]